MRAITTASRTHRALAKDAPVSREFQRIGRTVSHALVGGTASSIRPNLSFQLSFQLAVSVAQVYTLRMDTSDSLKVRVERRGDKFVWKLHRDGRVEPVKFSAPVYLSEEAARASGDEVRIAYLAHLARLAARRLRKLRVK